MIRTFADANVLIPAAIGTGEAGAAAIELLVDPEREFLASIFLEMEVKPKPFREGDTSQVEAIQYFLSRCDYTTDLKTMVGLAHEEMKRTNVQVLDALHVAAAYLLDADEFITLESARQHLYRNSLVRVVRLL